MRANEDQMFSILAEDQKRQKQASKRLKRIAQESVRIVTMGLKVDIGEYIKEEYIKEERINHECMAKNN